MKELLEKILASDVLTDENRAELTAAIETAVNEAVETQVNEAKEQLTVEYATQFAADREALIEAIDTKVEEMLKEQVAELADDISNFRDLEVEFANKLIEEKAVLAEAVEKDMAELVNRIDTFLEIRLSEEVEELKESIEEVRKNNVGRKIFEAFKSEVESFTNAENGLEDLQAQLAEAQADLAKRDQALVEAQKAITESERKEKLEETLSSLQNRPREIMEAILKTVATDKLQETYDKFIDRVLHESVTKSSEKESDQPTADAPVLAEGKEDEEKPLVENVTLVTGDTEASEEQKEVKVELSESAKRLQRLAGVNLV